MKFVGARAVRVADAGHDPRRFTSDLLERLRDLIVLQRVPDAVATGLIEAPDDQLERMTAQAAQMGQATVSRLADIAHNGLTEMRGTTAPRLLLELVVGRMLLPGADDSQGAFLQRLERPEKQWKFSAADLEERAFWGDYMEAYEDALSATSTEWAPWYVVPADHKWATRALVADVLTSTIRELDLKFPEMTEGQRQALAEARKKLEDE